MAYVRLTAAGKADRVYAPLEKKVTNAPTKITPATTAMPKIVNTVVMSAFDMGAYY